MKSTFFCCLTLTGIIGTLGTTLYIQEAVGAGE